MKYGNTKPMAALSHLGALRRECFTVIARFIVTYNLSAQAHQNGSFGWQRISGTQTVAAWVHTIATYPNCSAAVHGRGNMESFAAFCNNPIGFGFGNRKRFSHICSVQNDLQISVLERLHYFTHHGVARITNRRNT